MRDLYRCLLTIEAGILSLWLIIAYWPLAVASQAVLSCTVILICSVLLWRQRMLAGKRNMAVKTIAYSGLPPENFPGAVILVCGDSAPLFAEGSAYRETSKGWYLWVQEAEQLPLWIEHLKSVRPALVPRLSVLLATLPEIHLSADSFTQHLRCWQRAVAQYGSGFPLWAVTWLSPPVTGDDCQVNWFTTNPQAKGVQVYQPGHGNLPLTEWLNNNEAAARLPALSQALWLESLLCWQETSIDRLLSTHQASQSPMSFCAKGVCMVAVNGVADNPWQQHIMTLTALAPSQQQPENDLPLPDLLLPALPQRRGISSAMRFWRHTALAGALFLALAMLASYTNNQRLIRNVGDHLTLYHQLSGTPPAPKLRAQQRLRTDAALLDDWQRRGEPLRYRLGLYRGHRLQPFIEAAINSWSPPPVVSKTVQQPTIVSLDSMSLFDSGKYILKPGSTKMLIRSLVGIKARPGWLIVVAGHTDNTGSLKLNQMLSLQRAGSVRNWMRDTGDIPESCFAVQGYGASRPVANNDTVAGRARNRRVEISLVPQANAWQIPDATSVAPQEGVTFTN